ncbi:MAG: NAD-dependent epimerase/dehydratase family protein [Butyrivibrio sp.]|nr:NAD-dependent epimerase/dehydratase family protein [Butyrivibrio sp.]
MNALIRDNIEATKNLVCWSEKVQVKRIIYMSSVAVYGNVDGELCEESAIQNPSIYGITKHLGESIIKESEIPEKLILQLPKMIGPYVHLEDTRDSGFLTMTKKILNDEKVICFIPEMYYNNYLHVAELSVFLQTLLQQAVWDEKKTVLVAAQERLTMMKILQIMKETAESRSEIIAQSNGTMPNVSLINVSKAKELGFSPCAAEDMLRRFISEVKVPSVSK